MTPTDASDNEDTDILTPAEDSAEDRREDEEDLECAREEPAEKAGPSPWWKHFGPGFITGAADDDPSGIGTYSVTGAQFGYSMLWLVPFCLPLMIAVQEMCGRVGLVTGKGLAAVIKQHYPRWLLYGSVILLVVANVINIYADLNVMAASAKMLFHGPFALWLSVMTLAIVLAQVFIPYHHYVKVLKWLCLALGAYVVVALLPSVHNDWAAIARHSVIPTWTTKPTFLLTIVGFLGTTISPYLFFWQAGEEVEEEIADGKADRPGHRVESVSDDEMRNLRADTMIGMFASQAVCFFIIICTAATLHAHGKTDINTAQDAAEALRPLGPAAYWLFALGMLGTGLLAIPTLAGSAAYAVSETLGWRYGLYRRLRRARGFYFTVGAMTVIGALLNFVGVLNPVKALLYSAVLNGLVAVPLLIVLMLVCNNRAIVKERVNGALSNVVGWLTVALMAGAAGIMIWALMTGKAS